MFQQTECSFIDFLNAHDFSIVITESSFFNSLQLTNFKNSYTLNSPFKLKNFFDIKIIKGSENKQMSLEQFKNVFNSVLFKIIDSLYADIKQLKADRSFKSYIPFSSHNILFKSSISYHLSVIDDIKGLSISNPLFDFLFKSYIKLCNTKINIFNFKSFYEKEFTIKNNTSYKVLDVSFDNLVDFCFFDYKYYKLDLNSYILNKINITIENGSNKSLSFLTIQKEKFGFNYFIDHKRITFQEKIKTHI